MTLTINKGHSMYKTGLLILTLAFIFMNVSAQNEIDTEILWDTWGVPHIYADNNEDLFYAFGYAQMHNHADLILSLYARARGEQAAYWGSDFIESDMITHTVNVPEIAQTIYDDQNPEFKAMIDAFVAGMNEYAEKNFEAIAENYRPVLPIRSNDPLALAYYDLTINFVGGDAIGFAQEWGSNQRGSNGWAIAPERTESSNTMMILNPHLPWSDVFVWFEAQLVTPDVNLYGATLVGLPGIEIGFNDYLGWSHTVNTYDGFDVYELMLTEAGGYMLDGEETDFDIAEKTIIIADEAGTLSEFVFPVISSAHGPIIAVDGERALAFRVVQDSTHMMEQWWQMGTATNLEEFETAMEQLQIPMFNTIYGDREGSIYYLFNGIVPIREQGDYNSWSTIQAGDDSSLIWSDYHPYEDLPRIINPPTGFVQNANEPPWTSTNPSELNITDFPAYMAPQNYYEIGGIFRPQISSEMLYSDDSISFEELLEYKHNTYVEATDHVLDALIDAALLSNNELAIRAGETLINWDRHTNADSQGAILFIWWFEQYSEVTQFDMFSVPFDIDLPYSTPHGLLDPEGAVITLIEVAQYIEDTYGALDIPYGDVMRIRVGDYDLPGNGAGDPNGVFRAAWYAPTEDDTRQIVGGDSWYAILEFSDPIRAMVLLGQGNATQADSPHVGDQAVLFSEQRMREVWRDREVVEANLAKQEIITP
ncbi:MAG: acylase [Crocinitomicaceae bacterium]